MTSAFISTPFVSIIGRQFSVRPTPILRRLHPTPRRFNRSTPQMVQNATTSGARYNEDLPKGTHDLQLYSFPTPNGQKVSLMLEELGVPYDAWRIDITKGGNFSSGFISVSPNEKIPCLVDNGFGIFESGAILVYLAEKYGSDLYPSEPNLRSVVTQWLMWQMGMGPYLGQFGHFVMFASEKVPYAINRYTMEAKRLLDVLDKQLERTGAYVAGVNYSIADIAIMPWFKALGSMDEARDILEFDRFKHVQRWLSELGERDAVKRGLVVLKDKEQLHYSTDGKSEEG